MSKLTVEEISWATLADLQPYAKAYEMWIKDQDTLLWYGGLYTFQALKASVCNAEFWKRKGDKPDKYPERPFHEEAKAQEEPVLTEEEKRKWTELLFAGLNVKKQNFELSHKQGDA